MDERAYWKIKILIDRNAELTAEIERYKMALEQDLEDHKKVIVDFRRKITQLEEALDIRQAVYDKLLDDYTQLLAKSKDPILKVRAALDELMRLAMLIRANLKLAPELGHSREYLSGIEHAITTVEVYLGDVLK